MKTWSALLVYLIALRNSTRSGIKLAGKARCIALLFLVCLVFAPSFGQEKKLLEKGKEKFEQGVNWVGQTKIVSILKEESHSAQKATLYSAVIPGWGQAYNQKYWKIPIVWGGIAGVAYFFWTSNAKYKLDKTTYITLFNNPDAVVTSYDGTQLTSSNLGTVLTRINDNRKNRDLSVIIMAAVWGLNVIDANVDGHFFDFDIDEDLSMRLEPRAWLTGRNSTAYGMGLVLSMY